MADLERESTDRASVLFCHPGNVLNRRLIPRWLQSFSDLRCIVVIEDPMSRVFARIRREIRRVGVLRFLDVLAFRLYYRIFLQPADDRWRKEVTRELLRRFPPVPDETRIVRCRDPNSDRVREALEEAEPEFALARCKVLLDREIFEVPRAGTFVLHPGICPEYRNAHGCFWALARRDLEKVGLTLLKIDEGVDTGPVYGYFTYDYDEASESHIRIMERMVTENLDAISRRLAAAVDGQTSPIDTTGRKSMAWGQPWLTRYLSWKRTARSGRAA